MENELQITKWFDEKSNCGVSIVTLKKDGNKELELAFTGNLDLNFVLRNYNEDPTFLIGKDNYDVYMIFDTLYHDIMNWKVFLDEETNQSHKEYNFLRIEELGLMQNDEIIWKSDDFIEDVAPYFKMTKLEDEYLITFGIPKIKRHLDIDERITLLYSSKYTIPVRIRNSGSRYGYFNGPFMRAYHSLLELPLDYHQMHIEEYLYNKRILKK